MSIYFIPIVTLLGAALFRYRSIRALCRPISLSLNTGSLSPYFALRAQYGLLATAIARWAIRLRGRPISLSLNTGFWLRLLPVGQYAFAVALFRPMGSIRALVARGCATLTPGCILAPHQGALFPLSQTSHLPQADVNSPAPNLTSAAGRCPFPRSKPHICRRQMSIPPLNLWRGGQGVRSRVRNVRSP